MSNGNKSADIPFECEIQQSSGGLAINYRLQNRSGRDLVVFNHIPTRDVDETLRYSLSNAYVDFDRGTLVVRLVILPLDLPAGVNIEYRPIPDVSLLKAGAQLEARVVVTEPVLVRNPVRLRGLASALRRDAKSPGQHIVAMIPETAVAVRFDVGLSAMAPESKITPVSLAFPDVFRPPLLEGGQIVLTKDFRLPRPVPVLDYGVST